MSQTMVSILYTVEQHDTAGGLLMQLRGDEEDFRDKLQGIRYEDDNLIVRKAK